MAYGTRLYGIKRGLCQKLTFGTAPFLTSYYVTQRVAAAGLMGINSAIKKEEGSTHIV
ncbi:hypothetical protein JCM15457_2433 [Liquorilactobacillus sucicola DSM 21376 = JCM 15457]|uniref:Uncharacterized protein n=1 Tax=Liquorilactobacillus sucicola DSM 21376 = JCM 15457 TaxID=1423806 RepID=A0A023D050_9LACO|nr:hypothetical protein FD15_GL001047 [Liquorilactobacillus sucicola DSM 21376 = JCM 15457]GAJ27444.1 hypothetical protein JCM15457_2433 [Liquorilactobacillus sucicola DSM 21376 = JCM 15457]